MKTAATNMLTMPPRVSEMKTAAAAMTIIASNNFTTMASGERMYSIIPDGVALRCAKAS